MQSEQVIGIACIDTERGLGNGLVDAFSLKEDRRMFRKLTLGHPVIMGRRTWEHARSLPDRTTIVVSKSPTGLLKLMQTSTERWAHLVDTADPANGVKPPRYKNGDVLCVASIERALELASVSENGDARVWIAGGGEIYKAAMPYLTQFIVTQVSERAPFDCLATLPVFPEDWELQLHATGFMTRASMDPHMLARDSQLTDIVPSRTVSCRVEGWGPEDADWSFWHEGDSKIAFAPVAEL